MQDCLRQRRMCCFRSFGNKWSLVIIEKTRVNRPSGRLRSASAPLVRRPSNAMPAEPAEGFLQ